MIPLFLPLHHIHGIINILSCGLWAGARVHLFAGLDIPRVTAEVAAGVYNVFMAVPTVYVKLIQHLEKQDEQEVAAVCAGFKAMRLNISGSAACPVKLFEQWRELTGQVLLERYGMTEIGMGISNPYHGERRAGYVGQPLPGVEVQLFDESHRPVEGEGNPGEIRIKGDNVFLEYWGNEEATRKSFVDGWFCSGDMAVIEDGYYRIMGRTSVDIIKSGGYKLSALEIEGVLLTHDDIAEVAVIGAEDEVWGEAVTAFVVTKNGDELDYAELKSWCNERMSSYKIPKHVKRLDTLPPQRHGQGHQALAEVDTAMMKRRNFLGAALAGAAMLPTLARGQQDLAPAAPRTGRADAPALSRPGPGGARRPFRPYILFNTPIRRHYTGTLWAEGPAWSGVGRYLVWSDIPNNRQLRWLEDDGHVTEFRNPSGHSNGNTFDAQGRQISCEHGGRRVVRYEHDGSVTVIADSYEGRPLNSPNDAAVHPDGSIWFTDPPYGIRGNYEGHRAEQEHPLRSIAWTPPQAASTA